MLSPSFGTVPVEGAGADVFESVDVCGCGVVELVGGVTLEVAGDGALLPPASALLPLLPVFDAKPVASMPCVVCVLCVAAAPVDKDASAPEGAPPEPPLHAASNTAHAHESADIEKR